MLEGSLTAAVQVQQPRHLPASLGEPIEGGHPSFDALERPDVVGDVPEDDAVFLPFSHDLDVERFAAGIEVRPKCFDRLRCRWEPVSHHQRRNAEQGNKQNRPDAKGAKHEIHPGIQDMEAKPADILPPGNPGWYTWG